jgi:hypothetical protein
MSISPHTSKSKAWSEISMGRLMSPTANQSSPSDSMSKYGVCVSSQVATAEPCCSKHLYLPLHIYHNEDSTKVSSDIEPASDHWKQCHFEHLQPCHHLPPVQCSGSAQDTSVIGNRESKRQSKTQARDATSGATLGGVCFGRRWCVKQYECKFHPYFRRLSPSKMDRRSTPTVSSSFMDHVGGRNCQSVDIIFQKGIYCRSVATGRKQIAAICQRLLGAYHSLRIYGSLQFVLAGIWNASCFFFE